MVLNVKNIQCMFLIYLFPCRRRQIDNGKHIADEALYIADDKADTCPINPNNASQHDSKQPVAPQLPVSIGTIYVHGQ
jgi:hypothetical protein